MNERFHLFVYGQLRRGGIGYRRLGLARRTRWMGRAIVRGRLHDLGAYPGLILGGRGTVHGELLAFDDPSLWALLDAYEDCDPERPALSEYRRVEVGLIGGGRAWAYEYVRPVRQKPVVASGIWAPT